MEITFPLFPDIVITELQTWISDYCWIKKLAGCSAVGSEWEPAPHSQGVTPLTWKNTAGVKWSFYSFHFWNFFWNSRKSC